MFMGTQMVYGNGVYVNTGGSEKVSVSTDGVNWTQTNLPSFSEGVTFSKGQTKLTLMDNLLLGVFYLFGFSHFQKSYGIVWNSTNGYNWGVWDLSNAIP